MKKLSKKIILPIAMTAMVATPIVTVVSCGGGGNNGGSDVNPAVFNQGRRTIVGYTPESSFANDGGRVWDYSVQANNAASRDYNDMANTTLFRERLVHNSIVGEDEQGKITEKTQKEEKLEFDGIDSVILGKDTSSGNKITNAQDVVNKLKEQNADFNTMTFTVPEGIKYVNSKGEETKYNFKAIDFFYGMMRMVYLTEEVRESGTINGVKVIDEDYKMEPGYLNALKSNHEFYPNGKLDKENYENKNAYLYNLFGFDINGTIQANTGNNTDPNKFVLKFKDKINPALIYSIFNQTTFITPVSSEKINELSGLSYHDEFKQPGKRLQLIEYGKSHRENGIVDLSDELTVSRYYWKQYDIKPTRDGGTGLILQKNIHTFDTKFVNKNNNIEKYQMLIEGKGDQDTFLQSRQRSFLNDNSESILYSGVLENDALMKDIKANSGYLKQSKSSATGSLNQGMMNPFYFLNGSDSINDDTSLLLFGKPKEAAKTDKDADEEYFNGRGKVFRTLLNNSVNLYSFSKQFAPSASSIKTRRNFQPNQPIIGGPPSADNNFIKHQDVGVSVFSTSDADGKEWYTNHKNSDKNVLLKPSDDKFNKLKELWKDFINQAVSAESGLNRNSQFIFPLYDYRANDVDETPKTTQAFKDIVAYLNTLVDGTQLKFKEFDKESGPKDTNIINKFKTAPFVYSGAGADYGSVISIIQQYISAPYGFTLGAQILSEAIDNKLGNDKKYVIHDFTKEDQVNSWSIEQNKDIDITGVFDYITDHSGLYPTLNAEITKPDNKIKDLTLTDWVNFRDRSLAGNELKLLNEIDNFFQTYMFSISTNETQVKKWTNLFANYNVVDKLSIGYASYASMAAPLDGTIPVSKIYEQPWMHIAQTTTNSNVSRNLVDTFVDLN